MKLLLTGHSNEMRRNCDHNSKQTELDLNPVDFKPVVKLFSPWGAMTWLITEIKADGDTMFGLCDLGNGCPELGYFSLRELLSIKGPYSLRIERDMHFEASLTLQEYANEARNTGRLMV